MLKGHWLDMKRNRTLFRLIIIAIILLSEIAIAIARPTAIKAQSAGVWLDYHDFNGPEWYPVSGIIIESFKLYSTNGDPNHVKIVLHFPTALNIIGARVSMWKATATSAGGYAAILTQQTSVKSYLTGPGRATLDDIRFSNPLSIETRALNNSSDDTWVTREGFFTQYHMDTIAFESYIYNGTSLDVPLAIGYIEVLVDSAPPSGTPTVSFATRTPYATAGAGTATHTASPTPYPTITRTPTRTPSRTRTRTPSNTLAPGVTPTNTLRPPPTATRTPTRAGLPTKTNTSSVPTNTPTRTNTPTDTSAPPPTNTPGGPTDTPAPADTATGIAVNSTLSPLEFSTIPPPEQCSGFDNPCGALPQVPDLPDFFIPSVTPIPGISLNTTATILPAITVSGTGVTTTATLNSTYQSVGTVVSNYIDTLHTLSAPQTASFIIEGTPQTVSGLTDRLSADSATFVSYVKGIGLIAQNKVMQLLLFLVLMVVFVILVKLLRFFIPVIINFVNFVLQVIQAFKPL